MNRRVWTAGLAAVVLVAVLAGASFSWFYASAGTSIDASAGNIDLALTFDTDHSGGAGGFELENTGSLPVYTRLWYAFQYWEEGQPVLKDVKGIGFAQFNLTCRGDAVGWEFATLAHTAGVAAGEKDFMLPVNGEGQYYLLQPGETLKASYSLEGIEGSGLRVNWVAEAIQAGEAALADGAAYGWDADMA